MGSVYWWHQRVYVYRQRSQLWFQFRQQHLLDQGRDWLSYDLLEKKLLDGDLLWWQLLLPRWWVGGFWLQMQLKCTIVPGISIRIFFVGTAWPAVLQCSQESTEEDRTNLLPFVVVDVLDLCFTTSHSWLRKSRPTSNDFTGIRLFWWDPCRHNAQTWWWQIVWGLRRRPLRSVLLLQRSALQDLATWMLDWSWYCRYMHSDHSVFPTTLFVKCFWRYQAEILTLLKFCSCSQVYQVSPTCSWILRWDVYWQVSFKLDSRLKVWLPVLLKDSKLKLYTSWFCPFAQRAWIASFLCWLLCCCSPSHDPVDRKRIDFRIISSRNSAPPEGISTCCWRTKME